MLFQGCSCIIPLLLLYIYSLATVSLAQESQKRRHDGHQHTNHILEARWDIWTVWSSCSVECGLGITTRARECRSMTDGSVSERCEGKAEEIKICEITGCIKQVEQHCQELEQRVYGGKRYRWIPYKHPSKVCEIACRPVGAGFYLGLGKSVSDGTRCGKGHNQACIKGQCESIGCDGLVQSDAVIDTCGVCGGDNDTCKRMQNSFTDSVKFGYHTITTIPRGSTNIFISEQEQSRNYLAVKATDGSFQINNGFRLSRFGEQPGAGTLFIYNRNAGPDCPDECISADGPTDVSVEVMILAYSDNKGVKYSYSVPVSSRENAQTEEDASSMVYIDGGRIPEGNEASDNSQTGEQIRPIFSYDFKFKKNPKEPAHAEHEGVSTDTNMVDSKHGVDSAEAALDTGQTIDNLDVTTTESNDIVIEDDFIDNDDTDTDSIEIGDDESIDIGVEDVINKTDALQSPQPGVITQDVNSGLAVGDMYNNDNSIPSLYSWTVAGYTTCSQTCGHGKQSPVMECIVTDKKVKVDYTFCIEEEKPSTGVKECNFGPCPPRWKPGQWSKCSVTCGSGIQSRDYVCVRSDGVDVSIYECGSSAPKSIKQSCDMGSCTSGWYYTEWPEHCPAKCTYGTLSRRVHCFSDTGNERTACPERDKPEVEKSCRNDECGGFWLTGPWSECNATCGMAYQTRAVACAQRHNGRVRIVSESVCVDEERPPTYMSCDLKACYPEWYMNEWSMCSVTCGSGYRSRDVRCLDSRKQISSHCDTGVKPPGREQCKVRRCPLSDESRPPKREQTTQSYIDRKPSNPSCKDHFSQCNQVLQSRLCQYKYYQKICCLTCESGSKTLDRNHPIS